MIKTHITFLYTDTIHKVVTGIILVVGAIFYTISEYKEPQSQLLLYRDQYRFEYITQGFYLMKFVLLFMITLLWIYATKISRYNVYLFGRYHPVKVLYSKWVALIYITVYPAVILMSIYVIVWSLYPMTIPPYTIVSLFTSTLLWIVIYHSLCFVLDTIFHHTFALIIPLFGFVTGMMLVGINNGVETANITTNYIQIIFPDVIYEDNHFILIYSPLLELSTLIVYLLTIWNSLQKNDYILHL